MSLTLDVTDIGRNVARIEGTARHDADVAAAHLQPAYPAKYTERMAAMFDTPERFGEMFSAAVVITPGKLLI